MEQEQMTDIMSICQLVYLERYWRDTGQWEKMYTTFHPDSKVRITWFRGTGPEFVEASKKYRQEGRISKHRLSPTIIRINGNRALAETPAAIEVRSRIGNVETDTTSYTRLFSRVRKDEGKWRLFSLDCIYEKDVMVPVDPSEKLQIDREELQRYRPSYKYLSYSHRLPGHDKVDQELPGEDRPDLVRALYTEADKWLMGND